MTFRSVRILLVGMVLLLPMVGNSAQRMVHHQKPIKLAYKFTPGSVLRYKLVMDMNMRMHSNTPDAGEMPAMSGKLAVIMREKTVKVLPNGDAQIAVSFGPMNVKTVGGAQIFPTGKLPNLTMVMSPNGTVKSFKGLDKADGTNPFTNMMNFGSLGQTLLPPHLVRVGDKWSQKIPMPIGLAKASVDSMLLNTNSKVGNHSAAEFSQRLSGRIDMTMIDCIPSPTEKNKTQMIPSLNMKGNILSNGRVYFSAIQGRIIRSESSSRALITMSMPPNSQGNAQNASMDMNMKLEMFLISANKS